VESAGEAGNADYRLRQDAGFWIVYSMKKEDIWVSHIPRGQ
jgi:hypothetical protein